MANTLKIRRGTGNPGSALSAYELGWDTSTNSLYIGNGSGSTLITTAFDEYVSIDGSGNATFTQDLTVNGDTILGDAAGDSVTLRGTVVISDSTYNTNIKGTLNVDEAATFDTTVGVTGALTVDGLSSLDGGIDVNGSNFTVSAGGNIDTVGYLDVNGNATLGNADTDTVIARGTVTLSDSTKVTNVKGTLNVDEAATFDTTVGVTGDTTLGGGNTVTNTIRGTVDISDATKVTTVKGTLNVDQAATFDTTVGVTGNTTLSGSTNTIGGTVNVSSSGLMTTVKGTLNVDEAVDFDSTLNVDGDTTLNGTLDIVGDIEIGTLGDASMTIDASTGDVATAGNVTVGGDLVVQGTTTTVNSTVVTIEDPVMSLGDDTVNDGNDRGIEFKYNDGSAKLGFFGFDATNDRFQFVPDATRTDSDNGPYSGDFGDFAIGEVYQPLTSLTYASDGTITNVSANWNKTYKKLQDGVENALINEIMQYDSDTASFIATSAPVGLTIDCGTY